MSAGTPENLTPCTQTDLYFLVQLLWKILNLEEMTERYSVPVILADI